LPVSRSERLEALIAALRASDGTSMSSLAEELAVSVRTIRRDIATLRTRGLDIEGERGRGGGVRFSRVAPLPPLRLDEREAIGLWLSVQIARRATGLPYSRASSGGLNKVLSALPAARRAQLRRLSERIVVGGPASPAKRASAGEISPSLLEVFERCFSEEVCLGFQYHDRKGHTTQRRVEPHGLYVESPVWYVLAIDIDKHAQRMFRMDRISNPRPFNRPFVPSREVVEEMMGPDDEGGFTDPPA
jgi:predicted DNA-binding transcriptional regulator YafY